MILTRVAWLLVIIWLLCVAFGYPLYQQGVEGRYIIGVALLLAAVGLGGYLFVKGGDLTKNERWGIILSIPVWLLLAYGFCR